MLDQFLGVHLHAGMKHDKEDAQFGKHLNRGGHAHDAQDGRTEYNPGKQFPKHDR